MTDPWTETTLGEVIELYDHERIPLSTQQRSQRQGEYPYYGASGIIDYIDDYIFDGKFLLISEDGANLVERKTPIAFFASGKFWVNNHAHVVRGIPGVADDYFLMSYIQSANILGYITGTAQPKLSQRNLKAIRLLLPTFRTQRKIAVVLSAYDDLIENNTRRIKILEEMAGAIYREWFVELRFPGHEGVEMIESELGLIPQGWEVKQLGEICHVIMGLSPKSEFYNETGDGLPFHQGVTDFGERFPTDRVYCTIQKRIAEADDILFSVRAPVGRINIANKKIVIGRGLSAIRSKNGNQTFLLQQLKDRFQEEDTMGSGAIFNAIRKTDLLEISLLIPTESVISKFEEITNSIFAELTNLTLKNANLRQTRNLLLPKLISGEIDVSELDIDTD